MILAELFWLSLSLSRSSLLFADITVETLGKCLKCFVFNVFDVFDESGNFSFFPLDLEDRSVRLWEP